MESGGDHQTKGQTVMPQIPSRGTRGTVALYSVEIHFEVGGYLMNEDRSLGNRVVTALAANAFLLMFSISQFAASQAEGPRADLSPELALTILGVEESRLLPGGVPDDIAPNLLLPSGGTVLGSLAGSRGGSVVVSISGQEDLVLDEVVRLYLEDGWVPKYPEEVSSGFVSRDERSIRHTYCRDKVTVALDTGLDGNGDTLLRMRFGMQSRGRCARDNSRSARYGDMLPIPMLEAPEGIEVHGGGTGSSGPYASQSNAELETAMPARALLVHYAQQLDNLGWSTVASCSDGPLAVQSWSFTNDESEPRTGLLLIESGAKTTGATIKVRAERDSD